MELMESVYTTPEEMVAIDIQLLMDAEAGITGEILRFWEAEDYFVVVGRSGKPEDECFLERCRQDGVKIIQRSSGGHAVLQGPGCLNYSAILSYKRSANFMDVRESYEGILGALKKWFTRSGHNVEFFPLADLALGGRKISGNAQTRKRKHFLHHGTILFDFDIDRISRYIKYPPTEPEYRKLRPHKDFLANISMKPDRIKDVVKKAFIGSPACLPVL